MRFTYLNSNKLYGKSLPALFGVNFSLDAHVTWVYEKFFHQSSQAVVTHDRHSYDVANAVRAAHVLPIMHRSFLTFGVGEELSRKEVSVLQLAGLFNDLARVTDRYGTNKDSAKLFYKYLTTVLGMGHDEAAFYACLIINKDDAFPKVRYVKVDEDHFPQKGRMLYFIDQDGELGWKIDFTDTKKPYRERVLRDSIFLCGYHLRQNINLKYTHFYDDIAKNNINAFDHLLELSREIRSLVEHQGASYGAYQAAIKDRFNVKESYHLLLELIQKNKRNFPILSSRSKYHVEQQATKINRRPVYAGLTEKQLAKKLVNEKFLKSLAFSGKLAYRGIAKPTGVYTHRGVKMSGVDLELHCMSRDGGNTERSVSLLLGYGAGMYVRAGFGCLVDELLDVHAVYPLDANTGAGTLKCLQNRLSDANEADVAIGELIKSNQFGEIESKSAGFIAFLHNEVVMTLRKFQLILFTCDPVSFNRMMNKGRPIHAVVPWLEAVCLHFAYQKWFGKSLPIIEYSKYHNTFKRGNLPTLENIITAWKKLCALLITKLHSDSYALYAVLSGKVDLMAIYLSDHRIYYRTGKYICAERLALYHHYREDWQDAVKSTIRSEFVDVYRNNSSWFSGLNKHHLPDWCQNITNGKDKPIVLPLIKS